MFLFSCNGLCAKMEKWHKKEYILPLLTVEESANRVLSVSSDERVTREENYNTCLSVSADERVTRKEVSYTCLSVSADQRGDWRRKL